MECIKLKKTKTRKNKKYIFIIIIGILLVIMSLFAILNRYYYHERKNAKDKKQVEEFFNNTTVEELETNEVINEDDNSIKTTNNYIAVLEIPTINLKRGLVDKNSPNNNVNQNIYMVKDTILPDESSVSHIILASHSGNSYVSYFKNLHKLDINDEVYFYYMNIKYTYNIYKIYEVDKTGSIELKSTNSSDITLITCKDSSKKQIVVLGTLKDKINY